MKQTWLQAQVPKDEWDKLNKRRQKLGLKWAGVLLPAVQQYLDGLEKAAKAEPKKKKAGNKKAVAKKSGARKQTDRRKTATRKKVVSKKSAAK